MPKIIVKTKFNQTGKRELITPLDPERIYAPATRQFKLARLEAEANLKAALTLARERYRQTILDGLAKCLGIMISINEDLPFTTRRWLGAICEPNEPPTWSVLIPKMAAIEESAWAEYVQSSTSAYAARDDSIESANRVCEESKREMMREVDVALGIRESTEY